jgi:hypothetical protein
MLQPQLKILGHFLMHLFSMLQGQWKMEQGDRLFDDHKDLEWQQGLSILSVISYRQGSLGRH